MSSKPLKEAATADVEKLMALIKKNVSMLVDGEGYDIKIVNVGGRISSTGQKTFHSGGTVGESGVPVANAQSNRQTLGKLAGCRHNIKEAEEVELPAAVQKLPLPTAPAHESISGSDKKTTNELSNASCIVQRDPDTSESSCQGSEEFEEEVDANFSQRQEIAYHVYEDSD